MQVKGHEMSFLQKVRRQKILLLMLLPGLLLVLAFTYAPLSGWYLAFSDYQLGSGIFSGKFVGFKHFARVFNFSGELWLMIKNTLIMNLGSILFTTFFAMTFAILLKEVRFKRCAKVVQTVAVFPYFVSWVITYSIINSLFAVNSGAINQFLVLNGFLKKGVNLLGKAEYAHGLTIGLNLWKGMGYNSIIFLAAISGIPQDQYESADLDGANRWHKIRYITMPQLMPTLSVLLIMNSGSVLNNGLDYFMLFQNGSNYLQMEVLDMYVYRYGLQLLDFTYATSVGILKSFVSIVLLLLVNAISRKLNGTSIIGGRSEV